MICAAHPRRYFLEGVPVAPSQDDNRTPSHPRVYPLPALGIVFLSEARQRQFLCSGYLSLPSDAAQQGNLSSRAMLGSCAPIRTNHQEPRSAILCLLATAEPATFLHLSAPCSMLVLEPVQYPGQASAFPGADFRYSDFLLGTSNDVWKPE